MKARKIVTFLAALMLTTNALAPFPAVVAEGVGAEETATEASATDTPAETAAMDPTEAIDVTEAPAQDATETQAEEKSEATEELAEKATTAKPKSGGFSLTTELATTEDTLASFTIPATTALAASTTRPHFETMAANTTAATATTKAYVTNPSYNPYDDIYKFREPDGKSSEIHIIDSAVLYVPYSYLLFPMGDVPQSTATSATTVSTTTESTTTESATTESTTTESTSTSATTSTSETTTSTTAYTPEKIEEWCHRDWEYDSDSSGAVCTMTYDGRDLIGQKITGNMEYLATIPSTCEFSVGTSDEKMIVPVKTVDVTKSWWFKTTLGTVRIPDGIQVVMDGKEITYDEFAELLKPAGNTLEIVNSTYAGAAVPSISENLEVSAMGGYPYYDEMPPTYTNEFRVKETTPTVYYRMPKGLDYYPESSELYGMPKETGTFIFNITSNERNEDGTLSSKKVTYTYELTIEENTNMNVYSESDKYYSLLDPIGKDVGGHDYVLEAPMDSVFRSEGKYDQFVRLWLNGEPLELGKDYIAEEGSTKATIFEETFEKKAKQNGINTVAAEFRVTDTESLNDAQNHNPLRVTAQNFHFPNATNTPTVTPYHPSGSNGELNPHVDPAPVNLVNVEPAAQNTSSGTTTTTTVSNSTSNPSVTTGDSRPYWLYVSAALVGLLGIFTTFPRRKTKTGEEQ